MTKKEIAKRLSNKIESISINEAEMVIDFVFETIAEGLAEDGEVNIGEWGTYKFENKKEDGELSDFPGPSQIKIITDLNSKMGKVI